MRTALSIKQLGIIYNKCLFVHFALRFLEIPRTLAHPASIQTKMSARKRHKNRNVQPFLTKRKTPLGY